jgi:HAD superfamily hydrolase (TIGR01509 family)
LQRCTRRQRAVGNGHCIARVHTRWFRADAGYCRALFHRPPSRRHVRRGEIAAGRKLPADFAGTVASATLSRFRVELRATKHAAYALSWLRGPKCVASSSSIDRIRVSLETTDLIRFFEPNLFSASEVRNGKPAPDLLLHAAGKMRVGPAECIVVEDSSVGVAAGVAAGMRVIGFVGGSHAGGKLGNHLRAADASAVISDMRALKSTIIDLRGW